MGDLPPLPDPTYIYHRADAVLGEDDLFEFAESGPVDEECPSCMRLFTAEQLRSYALEAVKQEREAIMELALQKSATFPSDSDYTRGYALAKQAFAAAIRARSEEEKHG